VPHRAVSMRLKKMATIGGQQDMALSDSECENVSVPYGRVCSSGVKRGEHIVTEAPEFRNNPQSDGPCVHEVLRLERRVCSQQFLLARPWPLRLLQQPDRNSSPNDTGFAAA
jgi:hypothetical protein